MLSSKTSHCEHTLCSCKHSPYLPLDVNINASVSGLDLYSAADYFPKTLVDPIKGPSYDVHLTAWQDAVGTKKSRWEWLEEQIPIDTDDFGRQGYPRNVVGVGETKVEPRAPNSTETKPRPELEIFGLAMLGGGKVTGTAHIHGKRRVKGFFLPCNGILCADSS